MRASWRQHGAFSRREGVGCDIKSVPDTGSRPHAIFKAGSLRSCHSRKFHAGGFAR
jgi:hypothetical protein